MKEHKNKIPVFIHPLIMMTEASHDYRGNADMMNHSTPVGVVHSFLHGVFYKHINPPGWENDLSVNFSKV